MSAWLLRNEFTVTFRGQRFDSHLILPGLISVLVPNAHHFCSVEIGFRAHLCPPGEI
jgi:hypothetical protein